jgi:hypothetical protein
MESSYEFGIEPSGSIKARKLSSVKTTRDLSSSAQLHGVTLCFHTNQLLTKGGNFDRGFENSSLNQAHKTVSKSSRPSIH